MKHLFLKYKKILLGILVLIVAAELKITKNIAISAYEVQKKVVQRKIFNTVNKDNFLSVKGEKCEVFYTTEDNDYIKMIVGMTDIYYPILMKEFGCETEKEVDIIVYPTREMLGEVVGLSGKQIPMGAYYGGVINVLSPRLWIGEEDQSVMIDRFLEEGPIVHELVHLVLDKKLKGNYDIWFTEGVALYYEKKYTGFEWREDLKQKSKAITIYDLENHFENLREAEAYRKSYDIIAEIVEKKGEQGLHTMIENMCRGIAFQEIYGETKN